LFSAASKDESVKLNFSLADDANLDDDDLINSPPSQCSDSNIFNARQLLKQMDQKKISESRIQ
jgi:hypothetical protein